MFDCLKFCLFVREWLDGESSEKAKEMLHTKYHEVEKLNTALNIKW